MNDVAGRQPSAGGDDGLVGFAAALASPDFLAGGQNLGSTGSVNGSVDAASAEQAGIGCIDDGRYRLAGYITFEK